jgi:putative acetyltransferase
MFRIRAVDGHADIETLRRLFEEYADTLGFGLSFQQFDEELRSLPGDYSPPGGCALLAESAGQAVGCVALRPLEGGACEMKRLYVRPGARGAGIGRALAEEALRLARRAGYAKIRLDTIDTMIPAMALYRSLGFVSIDAYRDNPIEGAVYFELALGGGGGADPVGKAGDV